MAIEATWDEQKVSRLLELPLGQGIRSQIAPKIKDLRARVAVLEGAIEWYQEQAEASSRAVPEKRTDAMMAILTVMSLDGGRRARAALAARPEVKR